MHLIGENIAQLARRS